MNDNEKQAPMPLREFWESLSDDLQERARLMTAICIDADISYEHLKHVINRRRRLGVDASYRLVEASGNRIDITDLIVRSSTLRL